MVREQNYELLRHIPTASDPSSTPTAPKVTPETEDGTKPETQKSSQTEGPRLLRDWWLELAAALLSALALVAMIVTLLPSDKRPLPQWRKFTDLHSIDLCARTNMNSLLYNPQYLDIDLRHHLQSLDPLHDSRSNKPTEMALVQTAASAERYRSLRQS